MSALYESTYRDNENENHLRITKDGIYWSMSKVTTTSQPVMSEDMGAYRTPGATMVKTKVLYQEHYVRWKTVSGIRTSGSEMSESSMEFRILFASGDSSDYISVPFRLPCSVAREAFKSAMYALSNI